MFRAAIEARYGPDEVSARYRAFDTICSATQERQDAVIDLLRREPLDLMVVVGGYNSSNTCNLARICADQVTTYHIAEPEGLVSPSAIRHRPVQPAGAPKGPVAEIESQDWLPVGRPIVVGLTAGASTPNNIIGAVVQRLETFARPA
jgi:4-hydroxy-3-methylbut-2-enyl diphosphate reductase